MPSEHQIVGVDGFAGSEVGDAKTYWSSIDVSNHGTYLKRQAWSVELAELFAARAPRSVFEFGCNAGKNLLTVRERLPKCFLAGIDINAQAIEVARKSKLRASVGDEKLLELFPNRAFDICFTVSVLDHMPEPAAALRELARMSAKALYLLEPWLGAEGRVVRNYNERLERDIDTTPYSYSWDYPALAARVLPNWQLTQRPMPLPTNLGPYYHLFELTRKPAPAAAAA